MAAEKREIEIALRSRGAEASADRLNKKVKGVGETADKAKTSMLALSRVAGAVGAAIAAGQVLRYAEAWAKVNNQLKLVTSSQNDLLSTQDSLVSLAQETRAGLSGTVTLYSKLDRATKDLGISEGDLLNTVKAINQAFIISGATAVEAENAIIQLAQGLQSGSLSGDEFNSVAEQAPRLLEALSAELGKNTKELKDLGSQGQLTSELIITSLLNQSKAIESEFGKTTILVSQGWKNLTDSLTVAIGALDDATGVTKGLGTALDEASILITNLTTGMNDLAATNVVLSGFERWQSVLSSVGIEFDYLNERVTEYRNQADFAEQSAVTFTEIIKDQEIAVNKLSSGYASLNQIFQGIPFLEGGANVDKDLDYFFDQDGIFTSKPKDSKPPSGAGSDFVSRIKLETQAYAAELGVRKQLSDGAITEQQANDALELQNILFSYEAKRQAILEQEFQTEQLKQEALQALREQEILAVQNHQERITAENRKGVNDRNRLDLLEQNARIDNLRTGASSALSLLSAFGNQSFKTQKKFAIADSIINIAAGVAKALNNPYPANLGFAAQVAAQGAGLLATIKSSNPSASSAAIGSSAPSAPTASFAPAPSVQNQSQQRVINITGLDGIDDDQPIPLTVGGLKSLLSSDENVNIAINQGQQNAQRVGAI